MPKDTREPQEILAHVTASRIALTSAIYGLSEAELTMAGAVGRWSVKDVMAHLGRWEEICLAEVQKYLRGEQSTEDYRDALPYNDRWEAELHMLSLQEAIGLFETAHYRVFRSLVVVKSRAVEWLCACLGARLDLASLRGARRTDSRLACRAIIYSDEYTYFSPRVP